ncbi:kynurenine aminotransferase-like [Coccinella septempunctata]|uniref:kynurenine aminotransferase-like n=1 Tax=Coccinella septempunctata TaxID=41139 RepID=UPI001D05F908|nr:kynurenine aminotransferase-like [Coccinella septempunctata]
MSTYKKKFEPPKRYLKASRNIWSEYTDMVRTHKPLDLTLGFPDFPPQKQVTDALAKVADTTYEQTYNPFGQTNLLNSLAGLYTKLLKRNINPEKELITMATGCQSLHVVIMSLVEENDEVIIIEPYFNYYEIFVNIAGGKCRFVSLRFPTGDKKNEGLCTSGFTLDNEELSNAFNEKTKLFILNTPNNPSGKVFTKEELSVIADLCKKWNVVCLADEVYEFFVYPPHEHVRIATLSGMWERTITMICPGKAFGVTGWELGVAYSSEELIRKLQIAHQNIVHGNNVPIQEAYAILYEKVIEQFDESNNLLNSLTKDLVHKRDSMLHILKKVEMEPNVPEGGFFLLANWSSFAAKVDFVCDSSEPKDFQFAKWMIGNIGLATIPLSSFYSVKHKHLGENYIRLCFNKKPETLTEFANIMKKYIDVNISHIE